MIKRVSKRRWKAKYRIGQYISREAILNHRLEAFVSGGVWHPHADYVRRPTQYELRSRQIRLPRFDSVNAPLSEMPQRAVVGTSWA